jgi:hypothetical protein
MKNIFSGMNLNQKLGSFVGILGFAAIFLGNPYTGSTAMINTKELGALIQQEADHVEAEQLADWIIQGKSDFRLLDLRSEAEFAQYHISGAENAPLAGLSDYPVHRNDKVILYSEGGIHAAQAWILFKAREYKSAYVLRGGLDEWKEKILFPAMPLKPSQQDLAAYEKTKNVSKFFGGSPQTGSGEAKTGPQMAMPKLEMPSQAVPPGGVKKKKKEGC